MDWLFYGLADLGRWTFDTFLVPAQNGPNYAFLALGFVGLLFWLRKQAQLSEKAANDPNQLK